MKSVIVEKGKEQNIDIIINPKRYDWCWINNDYVFFFLEEFIFYTYFDTEESSKIESDLLLKRDLLIKV